MTMYASPAGSLIKATCSLQKFEPPSERCRFHHLSASISSRLMAYIEIEVSKLLSDYQVCICICVYIYISDGYLCCSRPCILSRMVASNVLHILSFPTNHQRAASVGACARSTLHPWCDISANRPQAPT